MGVEEGRKTKLLKKNLSSVVLVFYHYHHLPKATKWHLNIQYNQLSILNKLTMCNTHYFTYVYNFNNYYKESFDAVSYQLSKVKAEKSMNVITLFYSCCPLRSSARICGTWSVCVRCSPQWWDSTLGMWRLSGTCHLRSVNFTLHYNILLTAVGKCIHGTGKYWYLHILYCT